VQPVETGRFDRSVAAELEAIFPSKARFRIRGAAPGLKAVAPVRFGYRRRSSSRPLIVGAAVATLVACAVASVFLVDMPAAEVSKTTVERPAQQKLGPTTPLPSPSPLAASATGQVAASVMADSPKPAAATPEMPAVERAEPVRSRKAAGARRSAAVSQASNPNCIGLSSSERARCMRPQVLAADQRMRGAYASAIKAGLSPTALAPYQRRWARLLEEANSDPHHVTAALGSMARELGEEQQRQRERL